MFLIQLFQVSYFFTLQFLLVLILFHNFSVASCFSSGILRNPERETNVEGGGFNSFSINC